MTFKIITKPGCTYCVQAKNLLEMKNLPYVEDYLVTDEQIEAFKADGWRSFPQIFHEETYVGGFDNLRGYLTGDDDDF